MRMGIIRQPIPVLCRLPRTRGVTVVLRLAATLASVSAIALCPACLSDRIAWIITCVSELQGPMASTAIRNSRKTFIARNGINTTVSAVASSELDTARPRRVAVSGAIGEGHRVQLHLIADQPEADETGPAFAVFLRKINSRHYCSAPRLGQRA